MRGGIDKEGYENQWGSTTSEVTQGDSKNLIRTKRVSHKEETQVNDNNTYYETHINFIKTRLPQNNYAQSVNTIILLGHLRAFNQTRLQQNNYTRLLRL